MNITIIVLAFIGTYFIELLYHRIILGKLINKNVEKFDTNNKELMKIDLSGYKLGNTHIY